MSYEVRRRCHDCDHNTVAGKGYTSKDQAEGVAKRMADTWHLEHQEETGKVGKPHDRGCITMGEEGSSGRYEIYEHTGEKEHPGTLHQVPD